MKNHCKLAIFLQFCPSMAYFWWILDGIAVLNHLLPFAPKKMGFWVQKWKILKFPKFLNRLISEALEALSCFPKGKKMFVSREELQTMILSTEWPLYHVGELRYGPPKFFGVKLKIPENAFLSFESSWCVYITKMVLSGTNWSHMENNDHCCHFGGIWKENNLFWA